MHRFAVSILLALALAGCGQEGSDTSAPTSTPTSTPQGVLVSGRVHAGPVCPVEQEPPDPACADRPVEDAVLVIEGAAGEEYGRVATGVDGSFVIILPPGVYTFVPQPVEGLLGTAPPFAVTVASMPVSGLDVAYDTGIR